MRRIAGFKLIKPFGTLSQRVDSDGKQSVAVPPAIRDQSYHGTSPNKFPSLKTDVILVTSKRAAEEDAISPRLIGFGSQVLGYEPQHLLAEFTETLMGLFPM